jgi:Bcr/CflA subfamily drug resistance transporter
MGPINENNRKKGAILAFILIPISGLATDVYLPSFPDMSQAFQVSPAQIQQTLALFLVSYGVGQFFAGTVVDSFGRYRSSLVALAIFALSAFVIVATRNIYVVYAIRVLQGICTAFIMVAKRAYFVDVYTGEQQKQYTSMLTIVWAVAPITAPFIGGYLQVHFGWKANFYLLGIYAAIMCVLEWLFSGETLQQSQPFRIKPIFQVYRKLIGSADFTSGVFILGLLFAIVMTFNMSIPFIVEEKYHLSAVVTGYCALLSGVAMFFGGMIGKALNMDNLSQKVLVGNAIQVMSILAFLVVSAFNPGIFLLMFFVILIHLIGGAIFNLFFTYCLTRFPKYAGTAGGVTSGGMYLVTSMVVAGLLSVVTVTGPYTLALCYLLLAVLVGGILLAARKKYVLEMD